MWNAYTDPARWARRLATLMLPVLLSGCLSGTGPKPGAVEPGSSARSAARTGAGAPIELAPAPKVRGRNAELFEQAVVALKAQDYPTAERLLRQVTDSQPELAGPWVNLGQVYLKLDNEEEARLAFRKAIAANPANCAAYNQLGVLSRQMGDFAQAENHYLKCLSAQPDSADVYLNLGILYELYLGRLQEALGAYRQYQNLSVEPDRKVAGWVLDLERRTGS
jgi:tetratricopeptide (TPR) repeat protein